MKKNGMFIVLIFALSVVLSSCGGIAGSGNSPSKTVEKVFDYYMKKDFDKVASFYASGDSKKLTKEEFDKVKAMLPFAVKQDDKKGGLKSYEITEETIAEDGNSAKVKMVKTYGNGDTDTDRLSLVKVDGEWLIKIINN
jgi:predicted small secreted protein